MNPSPNVDLSDARWDELDLVLCRASAFGPESWKRSDANAFLAHELFPAPGRALRGWEAEACLMVSLRLQALGVFVKQSVIPATGMLDGESFTGSPCVGGLRIDWYSQEIVLVIRVDDVAEIYPRVSIVSRVIKE